MNHLFYLLSTATNTENDIGTRTQAAMEIMEIQNAVIQRLDAAITELLEISVVASDDEIEEHKRRRAAVRRLLSCTI